MILHFFFNIFQKWYENYDIKQKQRKEEESCMAAMIGEKNSTFGAASMVAVAAAAVVVTPAIKAGYNKNNDLLKKTDTNDQNQTFDHYELENDDVPTKNTTTNIPESAKSCPLHSTNFDYVHPITTTEIESDVYSAIPTTSHNPQKTSIKREKWPIKTTSQLKHESIIFKSNQNEHKKNNQLNPNEKISDYKNKDNKNLISGPYTNL